MANISDIKPTACQGEVLRRTDSHVEARNKLEVLRSGDMHLKPPMFNTAFTTTPDNDPRWGVRCEDEPDPELGCGC